MSVKESTSSLASISSALLKKDPQLKVCGNLFERDIEPLQLHIATLGKKLETLELKEVELFERLDSLEHTCLQIMKEIGNSPFITEKTRKRDSLRVEMRAAYKVKSRKWWKID